MCLCPRCGDFSWCWTHGTSPSSPTLKTGYRIVPWSSSTLRGLERPLTPSWSSEWESPTVRNTGTQVTLSFQYLHAARLTGPWVYSVITFSIDYFCLNQNIFVMVLCFLFLFSFLSSEPVLQPWWQAADLQGQLWEGIYGFYWEVLQDTGTRLPPAKWGPKLYEICEYESWMIKPETTPQGSELSRTLGLFSPISIENRGKQSHEVERHK